MNYRDVLGFSDKQPKKKVVKEQPKPSVSDLLKEEFGDTIDEGPAYEFAPHIKKIDKLYDEYWDAVKDFVKVLHEKGMKKEGDMFTRSYTKQVKKWNDFFIRQVRKLM